MCIRDRVSTQSTWAPYVMPQRSVEGVVVKRHGDRYPTPTLLRRKLGPTHEPRTPELGPRGQTPQKSRYESGEPSTVHTRTGSTSRDPLNTVSGRETLPRGSARESNNNRDNEGTERRLDFSRPSGALPAMSRDESFQFGGLKAEELGLVETTSKGAEDEDRSAKSRKNLDESAENTPSKPSRLEEENEPEAFSKSKDLPLQRKEWEPTSSKPDTKAPNPLNDKESAAQSKNMDLPRSARAYDFDSSPVNIPNTPPVFGGPSSSRNNTNREGIPAERPDYIPRGVSFGPMTAGVLNNNNTSNNDSRVNSARGNNNHRDEEVDIFDSGRNGDSIGGGVEDEDKGVGSGGQGQGRRMSRESHVSEVPEERRQSVVAAPERIEEEEQQYQSGEKGEFHWDQPGAGLKPDNYEGESEDEDNSDEWKSAKSTPPEERSLKDERENKDMVGSLAQGPGSTSAQPPAYSVTKGGRRVHQSILERVEKLDADLMRKGRSMSVLEGREKEARKLTDDELSNILMQRPTVESSARHKRTIPTLELADEDKGTTMNPYFCLLYTSPSPRDGLLSRMPSSA
eukprot:TRINITY_DN1568_c0_g1_i1.p2 TRINITY_DN1568_c0_g1~~TRINITY_DN1568_c0_g1_i1.p2  ORF type:complete len:589 (-),score=122.44 TRINITY_DN1568_c0_g1_i1:11-1717(-)